MIDIKHACKVSAVWMSVVYLVCFAGVAFFPGSRAFFLRYALHYEDTALGESVMTFSTFMSGLVIWDIAAVFAAGLFAALFNTIKK